MLTLTGKEIKDLAEAVGLVIAYHDYTDEFETEMTIIDCPAEGVKDDGSEPEHYRHVAYLTDYPGEGVFTLGDEIQDGTQKANQSTFDPGSECLKNHRQCEAPDICGRAGCCMGA